MIFWWIRNLSQTDVAWIQILIFDILPFQLSKFMFLLISLYVATVSICNGLNFGVMSVVLLLTKIRERLNCWVGIKLTLQVFDIRKLNLRIIPFLDSFVFCFTITYTTTSITSNQLFEIFYLQISSIFVNLSVKKL
jgi:hypothetical protein